MDIFGHPEEISLEQEKLMRLGKMDAEQLLSRAEHLPESRHKALFTTTLENAMMWFNKAVSRSDNDKSVPLENRDGPSTVDD